MAPQDAPYSAASEQLRGMLNQAAASMTPVQRAQAERDHSRLFPFDFLAWPETEQLSFIAERARQQNWAIAEFLAPVATGCESWWAATDDRIIEPSRIRLLETLTGYWRQGKLVSDRMNGDLYALLTLLAGKDRYATIAERETAYLLARLGRSSAAPLMMLRDNKGSSQNGFDGFFLGSLPALGIGTAQGRYVGLEVKTVVDGKSLGQRISSMGSQFANRRAYRKENLEKAVRALKPGDPRRTALGNVTADQIATLLVVRSCTMNDRLSLPAAADALFDRVLAFNIFGDPIAEACRRVDLGALRPGIDRYNRERRMAWMEAVVRAGATDPRRAR